ncbi:glycogen/starch/alpha-glucan phosphorylase [Klebsiella pneumoniae]|nr:glycogen/starch/alpha-glucan phosphorylase [Klebsiella pneumoniae]
MDMLGKILPRHLQIIFEINGSFLKTLQEQN